MALCDGWEHATAYDFLLTKAESGCVVTAWPDDNGLAFFIHPMTSDLEPVFLNALDPFRLGGAVAFTAIARDSAPAFDILEEA